MVSTNKCSKYYVTTKKEAEFTYFVKPSVLSACYFTPGGYSKSIMTGMRFKSDPTQTIDPMVLFVILRVARFKIATFPTFSVLTLVLFGSMLLFQTRQ